MGSLGVDCVFDGFELLFCYAGLFSQYADCSSFSKAKLSFALESGYRRVLNLYEIAQSDVACLFVPEAKFDFSRFVRNPSVGYHCAISVSCVDKGGFWSFQNFGFNSDLFHSMPQVLDHSGNVGSAILSCQLFAYFVGVHPALNVQVFSEEIFLGDSKLHYYIAVLCD